MNRECANIMGTCRMLRINKHKPHIVENTTQITVPHFSIINSILDGIRDRTPETRYATTIQITYFIR
jgi:hypothetical protein